MKRVNEQKVADEALSALALDSEQIDAISKRLKRAHGQLGAVVRMLDEGRTCEEIVTQMAAVGKAINTAAFTLISANLTGCLVSEKPNSAEVTEKLQKLFLSLA
jgi:DNA-binding FrmR family transcriptional regulator